MNLARLLPTFQVLLAMPNYASYQCQVLVLLCMLIAKGYHTHS